MTSPASSGDELIWLQGLRCPACGNHNTLFVGAGNYVTCAYDKCPNPDYAEAIAQVDRSARIDVLEKIRIVHYGNNTPPEVFMDNKPFHEYLAQLRNSGGSTEKSQNENHPS